MRIIKKYLKRYYKEKIIGQVVHGESAFRLYEINILKSFNNMFALQVTGTQMNQSNIHNQTRLENLIDVLSLEHPKDVLAKMPI